MASVNKTLGARFKIEGEEEYKNVIAQLNAGSRTLATEMTRLNAQYKGNTDSMEYLTDKAELLNRMLVQQKEKTEAARKIHEAAAEAYAKALKRVEEAANESEEAQAEAREALAAADRELQKYAQSLNLAEANEFNLQHQIDDTNKALNGQDEVMTGLGDTVQDLAGKLGIRIPDGAAKALNGMTKLSAGTVAAMGASVAAVAALVKAGKELQQTTVEAAARADEILTKSRQLNVSASQYQALQYASPFVDVDVDTMTGSLSKLTKAMGDAASGSETAQAKFSQLGVSITYADGTLRDAYDVWLDTMDALAGMSNETERDAAAMELLGRTGQELAPIYRDGTAALREYTAAAEENYIMSDEQLEALARVDDAVQHLHQTQEANKNMIAAEWAPTAEKVLTTMDRLFTAAGKALVDSGIIQGFGELVQFGTALLEPVASLLESADGAPGRLKPVYEILHGIAGVFAWIADAANVVAGLFSLDFERIGVAMGLRKSTGQYSNLQKWQGYGDTSGQYYDEELGAWTGNYGRNATGNDNWRGGLTWVGESGPELAYLPRGTQIANAQDSLNAGGVQNYYINVNGVQELDEIITWFNSRRVTARMG